jgi:Protein of unknown function with HXXEE motif
VTTTVSIWIVTLGFFLTHQPEEVVYSIAAWSQKHPRPTWRRWSAWVARSPMASPQLRIRARTVAGQTAGVVVLGAATSVSLVATQFAATVLTTALMLAFAMHLTVSILTRSAMPGLTTSILPGLPGAVALLAYIWTR